MKAPQILGGIRGGLNKSSRTARSRGRLCRRRWHGDSRKAARLPEPARGGRARSSRARPRVATLPALEPSCVCDFPDGSQRRVSPAMAAEATRGRCCARADLGTPWSRQRQSAQLLRMRRAAEHRRQTGPGHLACQPKGCHCHRAQHTWSPGRET